MIDERPDPITLLARATAEEHKRGRLKIYLGMAAGAGKTYSMLCDAIAESKRGTDVVAGYIEPHGRRETEVLATHLEQLPLRIAEHQGLNFRELDLDAALKRHPQVLLIDELAHTNADGARHVKRWQDVEECLDQGIDVFTTLNVQHIESLTDVVTKIIGVPVHETVPDAVLRRADEIELIDITPEDLIQRLKDGKIYLANKVDTALANFFKPGNLLALRELVLRLTAQQVGDQLITHRRLHNIQGAWPIKPKILVCISPNYPAEQLIRAASRLASSMHTEVVALTVENFSQPQQLQGYHQGVQSGLELAESVGAEIVRSSADDVVEEILRVARERNANIIVVGKPLRSRLREYFVGSVVDELIRQSGDIDVYVITNQVVISQIPLLPNFEQPTWRGIFKALGLTIATTLFSFLCYPYLDLSNLIMFYLLAVAWAGSKLGLLESVVTSILSVLAFDFCFVPPRWTFEVHDVEYVVTFAVMLIIALLISSLTRQLKAQAELVSRRERRTASLYEVSKRLASSTSNAQVAAIVKERCIDLFGSEGVLFVPSSGGELENVNASRHGQEQDKSEIAVAKWVATHRTPAGKGTDTLSGSKGQYLPLSLSRNPAAVLGLYQINEGKPEADDPLLEAFATQIGAALERIVAEQEATNVQVQIERERVRSLLLSSISHDFRSPLAAISGAADMLAQRRISKSTEDLELVTSIRDEALRLSRLVRNVLDLTRLEAGNINLKIEWESIEEIIGTALERTTALLGKRQVEVRLPLNLPLVQVDASLIEQVFINLFENIAKHSPEETKVTITSEVRGPELVIEFSDTGPGLPAGMEKRIFEKACRGPTSNDGFGLGLTICQTIVHAHGGTISASNNPNGGGARFELTLPVPDQQPEVPDES